MATAFIFLLGALLLFIIGVYISDVTQTRQAIRRNYPVIGHLRYFFEHMGTFFRQYFFAMDREEMPFNRSQRSWVYRAAKDIDNTVAFGSTRNLRTCGAVIFVNDAFPTLGEDAVKPEPVSEVGVIAHSCGVRFPRQLNRSHARIVQSDGHSIPLKDLFPDISPNQTQIS